LAIFVSCPFVLESGASLVSDYTASSRIERQFGSGQTIEPAPSGLISSTSVYFTTFQIGSFAARVRKIWLAQLVRELKIDGHTTKSWITQGGHHRLGRTIDQQFLNGMLRNRLYLGEISSHGQSYPGQHQAIIDRDLWGAVHAVIDSRIERGEGTIHRQSRVTVGFVVRAGWAAHDSVAYHQEGWPALPVLCALPA
jgi:hypothetical protein